MTSALKRLPGNTFELTIVLSWTEIKATFDTIFKKLLEEVEVPGFRKGKAPKELAQKHLNQSRIYEEVLKEMVPHAYADSVKQHNLKPIISPKVEVMEAEENKDWRLRITVCEEPTVTLGEYRKALQELRDSKQTKIWVPGEKKGDKKPDGPTLGEVLDALAKVIEVDLSDMLVEQEVNRQLSNLINETQKLGMTVEQYLQAQGKTQEQLRQEYTDQSRKTLSLEFALEHIAEAEKITVEQSEIETVIKNAKTETERQNLEKQRYYLGSLIRRQKTLSHLLQPSGVEIATSAMTK